MIQPSPNVRFLQHPPIEVMKKVDPGKRLIVVGESDKGQLYHPTLVFNKKMAEKLFERGPLLSALEDVFTYSEDISVYLMRIEKNQYELALEVLESFPFDLIFFNDLLIDQNFHFINHFIEFAHIKEEQGNLIHGIFTLKDYATYKELLELKGPISQLSKDVGDSIIEEGKYFSLVVNQGEDKDAGAVYAGLLVGLDPHVSPINKTIPDFDLKQDFTKEEILQLRSIGIVCFRQTFKKGVTCTSSSCAVSTEGSVHKHISNYRIAQTLINHIAQGLQVFIGLPHINSYMEQINEIVRMTCDQHKEDGYIRDYDYQIEISERYGVIRIQIQLVPIFSVYEITAHTRVRIYR